MATSNDIKVVINSIWDVMRKDDWDKLDEMLRNFDVESEEDFVIHLAYARTPFNVRNRLKEWKPFIKRLQNELKNRREIEDGVLHGLVNEETGEPV